MTINEQIQLLINQNKATILSDDFKNLYDKNKNPIEENTIVFDGVVNQDIFKSGDKFLFLLKEAVDSQIKGNSNYELINNTFDLITKAKQESIEQKDSSTGLHWQEFCEWIYAYKHPNDSLLSVTNHGRYLSEIALVNIKKVAGLSTTDANILNKIVLNEEYSKLLRKEIAIINPCIVICCGTFEQAKTLYGTHNCIKQLCSGVEYFKYNNIIFVDFIHPTQYGAAQKPTMKYAFAKEVFGELSKRYNEL